MVIQIVMKDRVFMEWKPPSDPVLSHFSPCHILCLQDLTYDSSSTYTHISQVDLLPLKFRSHILYVPLLFVSLIYHVQVFSVCVML